MSIRSLSFLVILLCCNLLLPAQYQVVGSAVQNSCSCYTLTPAQTTQNGGVWNTHTLNLNQDFDIAFDLFLGCTDGNGADGVAFVLQPQPTATGTGGGSMGYTGITPSVGVVLDTYQNGSDGDPAYDHLSININGDVSHQTANNLAGPVQCIQGNDNVEDCAWHLFRITWNATTKEMAVYFGGALRTQTTVDLVNTVFGGNPTVYWGMVGATGGLSNEQKFCARLNAGLATNVLGDSACIGHPIPFAPAIDALIPVNYYWWNFGDNTTSTQQTPPPHIYPATGTYTVSLVIGGTDGCLSDTFRRDIHILPMPVFDFTIPSTICSGRPMTPVTNTSNVQGSIIRYIWTVDGIEEPNSNKPNPVLRITATGLRRVGLTIITANDGCQTPEVVKTINVRPLPMVQPRVSDGCVYQPMQLIGEQSFPQPNIVNWTWYIDSATRIINQQSPTVTFNWVGMHKGYLVAEGDNGCFNDTIRFQIYTNQGFAYAGNDTTVLVNEPFTLNGSGNGTFLWTPAFGLNDSHIPRPTGSLDSDTTYTLTTITREGCPATDQVRISVFKGSKIFVPSAFTPNGDGLNETFKPTFIGIKDLNTFQVYNRWGQVVFSTNDQLKGWDGRFRGQLQPTGNYIYIIRATDFIGRVIKKKGYLMLIK